MHTGNEPPRFLSPAFHLKFFPSLLWRLMRPTHQGYQSPFANYIPVELILITMLAKGLVIFGFVTALGSGSTIGWILGIVGLVGFVALLISSIRSEAGSRPSYESFKTLIFLFFVFLGITAGLMLGRISFSHSRLMLALDGFGGFLLGYGAGIFGGLWIQRLGWIGSLFEALALAAIVGMVIVDIIMVL